MNLFVYWRGRWRLAYGFCPKCYSSPPRRDCSICSGERQYGPALQPNVARWWRTLWDRERRARP